MQEWNAEAAAALAAATGPADAPAVFFEFRSLELSDLPWRDQIHAAMRAGVLIGTHGAGLAHQVWMARGGAVVEVMHNVVSAGRVI